MLKSASISLSESELASIAGALGADGVAGLSEAERTLLGGAEPSLELNCEDVRSAVQGGADPLGEAFARLRSPADRRPLGATYTPQPIVRWMMDWAAAGDPPGRVVDPGVGSARFLLEAGRRFPRARLIGVEIDPLAALIARANLAAAGFADRSKVLLCDYRALSLDPSGERTLFVGNPPYVRHHLIPPRWKGWLAEQAAAFGTRASQLAGLHVHFFLATALYARPGDYGVFITAAEWLDVNYGSVVRELFLNSLGGQDLVVLEPEAQPFADAAATAAISTFRVELPRRSITVARVGSMDELPAIGSGQPVHRDRFAVEPRWTRLTRATREVPRDFVELGELCRVHRGSVTGANKVWIEGEHSAGLPGSVLFPSVTRARELFDAGAVLADSQRLRRVIDLPVDLDVFEPSERELVERFLRRARANGADRGYIAQHRKAWWSIGLRRPPPIIATYMARRPPAFVRNRAQAHYINIAHGLYPRETLGEEMLMNLVRYLSSATCTTQGRTYAGGLTKFEPREMERIPVPRPDVLASLGLAA
ncbi:MAG TPA: N-6 DNA methylase [Longimicrobium sp.]|nr:N-6 DNA methylase [Longimicrobium sp.]